MKRTGKSRQQKQLVCSPKPCVLPAAPRLRQGCAPIPALPDGEQPLGRLLLLTSLRDTVSTQGTGTRSSRELSERQERGDTQQICPHAW